MHYYWIYPISVLISIYIYFLTRQSIKSIIPETTETSHPFKYCLRLLIPTLLVPLSGYKLKVITKRASLTTSTFSLIRTVVERF